MNRIVNQLTLSILLSGIFFSCQNNSKKERVEGLSSEQLSEQITNNLPPTDEKVHPGKAVYVKHCLICHQADGSGVPGMHPPLGPGSWVGRDPKELIAMMMKGLSGQIEVDGEIYNGFMPSQAHLTDQEMADVLSYIRSDFGNGFGPLDVDLVKKIRSGK